jgi:outer membrane protein assembly factor BamA
MKLLKNILLLVLMLCSRIDAADNKVKSDSTESGSFEYFLYPFVFFSPETDLAFGGGGIAYFQTDKNPMGKPSKITFSAYYTINQQYSIDVIPQIYLWREKVFLSFEFSYSKAIDKFFGIGNKTIDNGIEDYEHENFLLTTSISYKIYQNLQYGIIYQFERRSMEDRLDNKFLDDKNLLGYDGGISSGIGFSTLWDTRDNIFFPSQGGLYEIRAIFSSKVFGSDFDYNNYEFNFRHYKTITEDHYLAVQFYLNMVRGYPPFYGLAALGGQNVMRGYYEGRYRDHNYFAIQAAYRVKLFWRFGAVAFVGVGDVAGRVSNYKIKDIKPSYGAGLRYMMDEEEKLNLRVDLGFGKNAFGVYFSIEEAF